MFNLVYLTTLSVTQATSVPYNNRVTENTGLTWKWKEEVVAYFWPVSKETTKYLRTVSVVRATW